LREKFFISLVFAVFSNAAYAQSSSSSANALEIKLTSVEFALQCDGDNLMQQHDADANLILDNQLIKSLADLNIRASRLSAEKEFATPRFSTADEKISPETVSLENSIFTSRSSELNSNIEIFEARKVQATNEIDEIKIEIVTAQNALELLRRELSVLEPLVRNGLAPETRLIALQREEENSLGRVNMANKRQGRVASVIIELDELINKTRNQYVMRAAIELEKIKADIHEIQTKIQIRNKNKNTESFKTEVYLFSAITPKVTSLSHPSFEFLNYSNGAIGFSDHNGQTSYKLLSKTNEKWKLEYFDDGKLVAHSCTDVTPSIEPLNYFSSVNIRRKFYEEKLDLANGFKARIADFQERLEEACTLLSVEAPMVYSKLKGRAVTSGNRVCE
jgi:hypothetical protein